MDIRESFYGAVDTVRSRIPQSENIPVVRNIDPDHRLHMRAAAGAFTLILAVGGSLAHLGMTNNSRVNSLAVDASDSTGLRVADYDNVSFQITGTANNDDIEDGAPRQTEIAEIELTDGEVCQVDIETYKGPSVPGWLPDMFDNKAKIAAVQKAAQYKRFITKAPKCDFVAKPKPVVKKPAGQTGNR
ncbi:MAG TPA: hypothetical protein VF572_06985 [Candidatus Saccharimonadales bacterium]|jgi:hypothetical protein